MGNFEQKKRNKDYSFGSAVESVLSLLRAVKATPASKRPVEKYLKERAEKHRRSRLPRRSLSELPEDLQEAFRLKKRLEKLERENGYISAGAGKTTSVAAKVKYLVDRKGVKPEEILVISFTNKAVEELRARIQRDLGIPCPICTFHSAGNAVLHMQNPERVNIVDADKKFFVVRDYLRGKILQDPA
ncbi:MAG: UvrD-helicase domain-containing protein [Lachnospiraceae bacterium]|nr:UvrD-helicase domain-containing protein [Lachnospiraceae bacterium]